MKEQFGGGVTMGDLGSLVPRGKPRVYRVPNGYESEGDHCTMPDGTQGRLVRIDGRLVCKVQESAMGEALKEGVKLRFSSPSRTQIGKAHMEFDVHMRAVQGLGNMRVTPIQGTAGNWFFDVSSPSANQHFTPQKVRKVAGVNVTEVPLTAQAASAPQPKSVRERVKESVQALMKAQA